MHLRPTCLGQMHVRSAKKGQKNWFQKISIAPVDSHQLVHGRQANLPIIFTKYR